MFTVVGSFTLHYVRVGDAVVVEDRSPIVRASSGPGVPLSPSNR